MKKLEKKYDKLNMEVDNSKRLGTLTGEQKRELLEFMENHPELRSGKFSQQFTFKKAQKLWLELSEKLNAYPGAQKEWKQWRKVSISRKITVGEGVMITH